VDRQQLGECQRSIVFKTAEPLPSNGTANHLQQWIAERLGVTVIIQQVQLLGSRQQDGSGARSPRNNRFAYKVMLGSPGERTAVLRAKAQALRGSTESIDAMLTTEQLASRQHLMPVYRQAKAAGQAPRWRYGSLFVNCKEYTGTGSLPSPAGQQRQRAAVDQDGFQPVAGRERASPAQKPTAGAPASKKALFSSAGKQQQGSKPRNSNAAKQQQKGGAKASTKATSSDDAAGGKDV
jgi:hypothetical protein